MREFTRKKFRAARHFRQNHVASFFANFRAVLQKIQDGVALFVFWRIRVFPEFFPFHRHRQIHIDRSFRQQRDLLGRLRSISIFHESHLGVRRQGEFCGGLGKTNGGVFRGQAFHAFFGIRDSCDFHHLARAAENPRKTFRANRRHHFELRHQQIVCFQEKVKFCCGMKFFTYK